MTNFFYLLLAGLIFLSTGEASAQDAEKYAPLYYHQEDPQTIYLNGEIDQLLLWKFANLLDVVPNVTTIVLSSPGGEVYPALILAKQIDRMGLRTVILGGDACNSACSFLYFAGVQRTAKGTIGVHQIASRSSNLETGQVALADIIELLEGFSVPNEVIISMLRTSPEDMRTYTGPELEALGLTGPRKVQKTSFVDTVSEQQIEAGAVLELSDGTYSGSSMFLEIDGGFADLTLSTPNCTGGMTGFVRSTRGRVGLASASCFISVRRTSSETFVLEEGRGCNFYHGFRCSFDGTIEKVQ